MEKKVFSMQFQEKEFLPVILGADITAYSLARSFHEEYGIKSLVLSMSEGGYIANSDIIENRIFPGLENKDVLVKHLIEVGKEFEGKKEAYCVWAAETGTSERS